MNILRITTRIYPDIGGPAKQAYLISKYFAKNHHKVIIISCSPNKNYYKKRVKINDNFLIFYLPLMAPGYNASIMKHVMFFLKFFILGFLKALIVVKKFKIQVIHCHSPPPTGFISFFISKIFKIPYIYSIHGLDYPNRYIFLMDMKLIAKNASKLITVSKAIKDFVESRFNIKNALQFPNLIDLHSYNNNLVANKSALIKKVGLESIISEDDFIIIYVGHMILSQKVKGMLDFIEGFSRFLSNIKDDKEKERIKLLFAGDGLLSFKLKEKIKEKKLEENVFLLGKRKDIKNLLKLSELLGLTSYVEGFPNVILEASASKVPCLATNVGEIKKILGNNGFIINPGDIKDINNKIEQYYHLSPKERDKLKEKLFERVKNLYDVNVGGKKILDLYKNVSLK
ncbi:MAG: glycosyltransferase family 4 protein [Promethearchaeota archaeon]